ncbi:hypothetical protein [Motilibacter deserti]|uniref:Secreted protein with PEP-CTERM sorting signal n=1 Tax=Motilibacter deserti TaxID=2714956 RepID=A0ABX0H200_9ACTN|nr:hypothetical protein [Motilibacter deserti]NHC16371.1 hypothetical protein [Motilibacter deserti]
MRLWQRWFVGAMVLGLVVTLTGIYGDVLVLRLVGPSLGLVGAVVGLVAERRRQSP